MRLHGVARVIGEVANVGIVEIGDFLGTGWSQGDTIALVGVDRREIACHDYCRYDSIRAEVRNVAQGKGKGGGKVIYGKGEEVEYVWKG